MGLAGPRKRTKFSNDPNNTAWSRSTTRFGHTILQSQGWSPGETLGAKDSHHAHLLSAASSSHIRVTLREDNLGLGAKKGSGQDHGQCTGLDAFQGLLGRLNGKSDGVLKKEQDARDNIQRVLYTERRWGTMRFVRGGVLVGDDIENPLKGEKGLSKVELKGEPVIKDEETNLDLAPVLSKVVVRLKAESQESQAGSLKVNKSGEKIISKKRKREGSVHPSVDSRSQDTASEVKDGETLKGETKALRRQEKAERRAEKAKRKLERQQKKKTEEQSRKAKSMETTEQTAETFGPETQSSVTATAPENAFTSKPQVPVALSRHAVRRKFIDQKRRAVMDPKALNEIFMIKTKS